MGVSIGIGISDVFTSSPQEGTPPVTNSLVQQDGTSLFLLQDGISYLILQ